MSAHQAARTRRPDPLRKHCGVGVNDANYSTQPRSGACPIFMKWKYMIERCYRPKYETCGTSFVSVEWQLFSAFHAWMSGQVWEGLELDKDLLRKGNRIYGPETCCFVPQYLNNLLGCVKAGSKAPAIGVRATKRGKFEAKCNIGNSKSKFIGTFATIAEAHRAWQKEKSEQIEISVSRYVLEPCFRKDVADALIERARRIREKILRKEFTYDL